MSKVVQRRNVVVLVELLHVYTCVMYRTSHAGLECIGLHAMAMCECGGRQLLQFG
jgi:hypothetical protein